MSEMVERVDRAMRNVVFQTGGAHGWRWQIVSCWTGPDHTDEIMFVGRPMQEGESVKDDPPADMNYEMRRCKAIAAIKAMREPTPEMLAVDCIPHEAEFYGADKSYIWQAMIDAALTPYLDNHSTVATNSAP